MLTVDDRGRYSDGRAHDYLAYGNYKDLKVNGADPVTQKYQGKEFEAMSGLHAFVRCAVKTNCNMSRAESFIWIYSKMACEMVRRVAMSDEIDYECIILKMGPQPRAEASLAGLRRMQQLPSLEPAGMHSHCGLANGLERVRDRSH